MKCPVCKSQMIVVEHSQIELDYCTDCRGVWFDSGELELLLESMGLESPDLFLGNLLDSTEAESREKKRRCPICGGKMKKTIVGQEPQILIDVCRQGDGLWFDGGELGQLIEQLTLGAAEQREGSHHGVITFLGQVFRAPGSAT